MKKYAYITTLILLIFLWGETALAGFGITPPYVRNHKLTRSSQFTQEIVLVRGDPKEDLNAEITFNLPGFESWFTVDKGNKFILPKGLSQYPIRVTVNIPADAEYGSYTGYIRVRTSSVAGPAPTGVTIALGAQIDVDIQVVDKIFDFEIRRVELMEAEEGRKWWWLDFPGKITFFMHVENTGNVPGAPPKVRFEIYDSKGIQLLETVDSKNKIDLVQPFETQKIAANFPTKLSPGNYLVRYSIFKSEADIARSGELSLSVLPIGTIPGYIGYGFDGLSLGDKISVIAPPTIFVILIVILLAFYMRRRRRSGRGEYFEHSDDTVPHRGIRREKRVVPQAKRASGIVDLSHRKRK